MNRWLMPRFILVGALLAYHFIIGHPLFSQKKMHVYPLLDSTLKSYEAQFSMIPEDRKEQLQRIAQAVRESLKERGFAKMMFICTHNSRRSHIAQLWAKAAAEYFSVKGIETFSAGTESTAFNARAVAAMRRVGFAIEQVENGAHQGQESNPHYLVRFRANAAPIQAFSKTIRHSSNPHESFLAVMVCSHAEANCPFVAGAIQRLSLPYNDPKEFDGTPLETQKYDERVREIGRDLLWCMAVVAGKRVQ